LGRFTGALQHAMGRAQGARALAIQLLELREPR
jgi:hypothetical protein